MASQKVLVVAFDGMDKELIEKFGLENIPQQEFGTIDNDKGISRRMTTELFASFITGETHQKHGIKDLKDTLDFKDRLIKWLIPKFFVDRVRGLQTLRDSLLSSENDKHYSERDIQCDTIFEKIDASLPLYIPSYNPEVTWTLGHPHHLVQYVGEQRFVEEARHNTEVRLRQGTANQPAFLDVTKDFWDFIMLHLHDPDALQDVGYGNLEEEYERLDKIASEILEEYADDWTVIFMSDHGRPEKKAGPHGHNKNAFYSCNRELFGENQTPHITDFHDKILDITRGKE